MSTRRKALANLGAKLSDVPTRATLNAITSAPPRVSAEEPRLVPLELVDPSPFQPHGRPSAGAIEAVREAIEVAGSLSALVTTIEAGAGEPVEHPAFKAFDGEARELALLAADIGAPDDPEAKGIEVPLEVRRVGTALELLSGHRRLAAAKLAGRAEVPVVDRGEMPDHEAAAIVFRRNRLRADFTPWQEAISLAQIQERRRAAGLSDSVRALARAMGYSHGRAGELLQIARAFPRSLLEELGNGQPEVAEEALARLPYRTLRGLVKRGDSVERLAGARRTTGLGASESGDLPDMGSSVPLLAAPAPLYERVERRGGGFTLTVLKPAEQMPIQEARTVLAILQAEVKAFRARVRKGDP